MSDSTEKVIDKHNLSEELDESGKFAFCSLVALVLNQLYPETFNKKYKESFMKSAIEKMKCSSQVEKTITQLAETDCLGDSPSPYIASLKDDNETKEESSYRILREFLSIALHRAGAYDSRSRSLLKYLSLILLGKEDLLNRVEKEFLAMIKEAGPTESELEESKSRSKSRKVKRGVLIGLAAVGGGALIGLTGGLAAPLIAAGAGAVFGGTSAVFIASTAGAAVIGSLFGVAGAGLTGYKMKRRVGALKEFEFLQLSEGQSLSITVTVSGYIDSDLDFYLPWRGVKNSPEQYYLRWESDALRDMGKSVAYFLSYAKGIAIQETLKMTVLSALMAAITWPAALVTASSVIDNPWSVCATRAKEAGKVMAEVLMARQHGRRPVTLIGFSSGARVIFYCLKELAARTSGGDDIIEDVILLGAPVTNNASDWQPLETVVSGRIVNGFCKSDWILRFLFRTATASYGIAGLTPIQWNNRRMVNIDLTSIVSGHEDYLHKLEEILPLVGVPVKVSLPPRSTSLTAVSSRSSSLLPPTGLVKVSQSAGCLHPSTVDETVGVKDSSGTAEGTTGKTLELEAEAKLCSTMVDVSITPPEEHAEENSDSKHCCQGDTSVKH